MKRGTVSFEEMTTIAGALDVGYEQEFVYVARWGEDKDRK